MQPLINFDDRELGLRLLHKGKVRNVYEIDEETLLLVASDRLSAFDHILPTPIPGKGVILTQLSIFWFEKLEQIIPNHYVGTDVEDMHLPAAYRDPLRGRSMLVKRTDVLPVECVVRGYLEGSGWREYKEKGSICGIKLPEGLRQCDKLPTPVFTPSTKNSAGHDENISFDQFSAIVGSETADLLRDISLQIFNYASEYAIKRGLIVADTKFEFGRLPGGEIILIDEALTPDSSRFWPLDRYRPGTAQPSFDKQFVREYLESIKWNKMPPAPSLPQAVVDATLERYRQAFRILTGCDIVI